MRFAQLSVRLVRQLEITVAADADLFDILAYGTVAYGETKSDEYYNGIIDTLDFLCRTPFAGPIDDDNKLGLRRWRYRQHRIFYDVGEDTLLIVRIFHVAADAIRGLDD